MKAVYTIILFVLVSGSVIMAQESDSKESLLIGEVTRSELQQDELYSIYHQKQYDNYSPDFSDLNFEELSDYEIKIILGTWCHDSQVQVPRFLKVIDTKDYSKEIVIIAVDRNKKTPGNSIDNLNIKRVPTFIFYQDGKEAGRIVESPKETLEDDIASIINHSM